MLSRWVTIAKTLTVAWMLTGAFAATASATDYYERLYPNESLYCGDRVVSWSGDYTFQLSCAGGGFSALLQTSAPGAPLPPGGLFFAGMGDHAIMQTDGNFVLYRTGTPTFATGTAGMPGNYLQVQDDSNIVVYTSSSAPVWSSW